MEKTAVEQEREIKDIVRRAKGNPDKTGSFRRETLRRLLDLIQSPHPTLKILAAQNIRFFFNDFPELEEAAINAVYDLCEDHSSKVRIEGYTAITQVSRAENKWVKRNADVLLQLLQSDEPDEVIVVKKALTEHLDMDPRVTLGVLCDQIVPPEEIMDEEEQAIRDRLRTLVLSFLTGEAKRAIIERHALPGSAAEAVLINCLLEAIPKLGINDVEIIVKNLLLSMVAYKPQSSRGYTLLQILLDKVSSLLRDGLRSGNTVSLGTARSYLGLAGFMTTEKQAAPPVQLLRFYCTHLSSKMTLQKFPAEAQVSIICDIAETLTACSNHPQPQDDGVPLDILRRQIVDSCPFLLESLHKHGLPDKRPADACVKLLRACIRRKDETSWIPPFNLISVLTELQTTGVHENMQDAQILIRSLVPSTSNPSSRQGSDINQTLSKSPQPPGKSDNGQRHLSLPAKPSPPRRIMVSARTRQYKQPRELDSETSTTTTKHLLQSQESSRSPKRQKQEGNEDQPSLLSRLGTSLSNTTGPAPRFNPTPRSSTYVEAPGEFGYSIKGAAKIAKTSSGDQSSIEALRPFSLLDRLEDGSSVQSDDRTSSGWERKKRGRTY